MKNTFLLGMMLGTVGTTFLLNKSKCKALWHKIAK